MASPLTGPFQLGIETSGADLVVGEGSPVAEVSFVSLDGLGGTVNNSTAQRVMSGGVIVGLETAGSRTLNARMEIFCPGEAGDAMDWWVALDGAFAAVEEGGTLRKLWLWLPGAFGHRELEGRPRGMSDDGLVSMPHGYIEVTCSFEITTGDLGTVQP